MFFFSQAFFADLFFWGGWLDSREYFIMWRTRGDVEWRDHGYEIFQTIEKHARTRFLYSAVRGIDGPAQQLNDTNSFKLDEWVFDAEAHPLFQHDSR